MHLSYYFNLVINSFLKHIHVVHTNIVDGGLYKKCLKAKKYKIIAMAAYPRLFSNDCRFSIFGKRCTSIMHHATVVVLGSKRVDCAFAILSKVVLVC